MYPPRKNHKTTKKKETSFLKRETSKKKNVAKKLRLYYHANLFSTSMGPNKKQTQPASLTRFRSVSRCIFEPKSNAGKNVIGKSQSQMTRRSPTGHIWKSITSKGGAVLEHPLGDGELTPVKPEPFGTPLLKVLVDSLRR